MSPLQRAYYIQAIVSGVLAVLAATTGELAATTASARLVCLMNAGLLFVFSLIRMRQANLQDQIDHLNAQRENRRGDNR